MKTARTLSSSDPTASSLTGLNFQMVLCPRMAEYHFKWSTITRRPRGCRANLAWATCMHSWHVLRPRTCKFDPISPTNFKRQSCCFHRNDMGVSKNRGTPQIIRFNRVFHYKPSSLGYHYFGSIQIESCSFSLNSSFRAINTSFKSFPSGFPGGWKPQ